MNYGALMGYAAAAGACEWGVVLPLYLAGVNWTLIYDTIYAHQVRRSFSFWRRQQSRRCGVQRARQCMPADTLAAIPTHCVATVCARATTRVRPQDKRDDALVGVKSTALLFGDRTKAWACGFALLQGAGMAAAGQAAGCGAPFFAAVAAGSAHIAWQIGSVDLQDGPDCMAKFVSNKWYGAIIYAGVLLDRLLAPA
jgi:4-hydroxybenzoate polyprenyltransferase